jgi:hypothetical protein
MILQFKLFILKWRHIHIGYVRLEWNRFQILWPRIAIMKPYLPQRIFFQIKSAIRPLEPTKSQLRKIASLGESIGLEKNEIIAAIDAPLAEPGMTGKSRLSLYLSIIIVTIIAVFGILLTWYVVDPDSFPVPTYVPGSLYGSIRPQDFQHYNHANRMV